MFVTCLKVTPSSTKEALLCQERPKVSWMPVEFRSVPSRSSESVQKNCSTLDLVGSVPHMHAQMLTERTWQAFTRQAKRAAVPKKLFRNTHKASDRESALQLPRTNRCNPKLWECISDHSLHASYCWWRVSIITHLFFSWCIYPSIVPPLDGKQCKHPKRREGCD